MDGRNIRPVLDYIEKHYGSEYPDFITDIGPNKVLAEKRAALNQDKKHFFDWVWSKFVIMYIRIRLSISVHKHHSKMFFIVGHDHCAGNPAHKATQIKHLKEARKTVENFGFKKQIVLLWAEEIEKTGKWIIAEEIE